MENQFVIVHKHKGKWRIYKNGAYTEHDEVFLKNVSFIIIPELQKKSQETKERIPHAYAHGIQIESKDISETKWQNFEYDVFTQDTFVINKTQQPIYSGRYIHLGKNEARIIT